MVLKLITEGHKYFTKLYIEVADQTFDLVNRIMGIKVLINSPFLILIFRKGLQFWQNISFMQQKYRR